MPASYASLEWDRWGLLAWCARYGHQPLSELRALSDLELRLFTRRLVMILENERPEVPGAGGGQD